MRRCKKHYTDQSSVVGVCASCLRERLICIIAAQEESNHNSETHLAVPRSVSPYICKQKTDNSDSVINSDRNRHRLPDRRFFSTPQVAPTTGSDNPCRKKHHGFVFFSVLSNLFRSKKRNEVLNPRSSISCGGDDNKDNNNHDGVTVTSTMSSPYWLSNMTSGGGCRKKKNPVCFSEYSTTSGVMRNQYCSDRGMSPVRNSDSGDAEDDFCNRSSGYETSESRKQTPRRTPVRRGGDGGHRKNVSGISFCLSPLVRTSPCRRHWTYKGVAPVDGSGEIRAQVKAHLSITKGFCANRSRKLADFGRIDMNR